MNVKPDILVVYQDKNETLKIQAIKCKYSTEVKEDIYSLDNSIKFSQTYVQEAICKYLWSNYTLDNSRRIVRFSCASCKTESESYPIIPIQKRRGTEINRAEEKIIIPVQDLLKINKAMYGRGK